MFNNWVLFILRLFGLYYKLIYLCIVKRRQDWLLPAGVLTTAVESTDEIRIWPGLLPAAGAAVWGGENKIELLTIKRILSNE